MCYTKKNARQSKALKNHLCNIYVEDKVQLLPAYRFYLKHYTGENKPFICVQSPLTFDEFLSFSKGFVFGVLFGALIIRV